MAAVSASYELRFDAGRVCLDLVATVNGRFGDEPVERLDTPHRLGQWLVGARLLLPEVPPDVVDAQWLDRFRTLRDLLFRVVYGEFDGRAADTDVERINALAAAAPPALRAVRAADGSLVRAHAATPPCEALLAQVARDAVDLLTDATARDQLRRCEGESCALIYLDTSRGRRRRWCSSEVCGNRERVARHRRRAVAARA